MTRSSTTILHIITGLSNGGAEAVLYRLCTSDRVHKHKVVSMRDGGKFGTLLEAAEIPVVCLDMPRGRITFRGLWRLWRLIRRERPIAVQTWMYHADLVGGIVARLAGLSNIYWGIRHTTLNEGEARRLTMAVAWMNARLSHVVPKGIVCCADRAREVHRELGYAVSKMTVIHNGYEVEQFAPDPAGRQRLRGEWGITADEPLLGMVGRFHPQKDHNNLLKAVAEVKQSGTAVRLVLVGDGLTSDNAQVAGWLNDYGLGDDVILLGPRRDIPAVMAALDIHVLPAIGGEAFPNVVAEAMACGTPCVVTDVGDAALILGGTGWVVPPANSQALAKAIQEAFSARSDVSAWQKRRVAARARVEDNFSLERMMTRYHEVWNN